MKLEMSDGREVEITSVRDKLNVAIVTYCKGRLASLRDTFDSYATQELSGRFQHVGVVLVDYDCPDQCGEWAKEWASRRTYPPTVVVQVQQQPLFRQNHARNIAALAAIEKLEADLILSIDCDTRPLSSGSVQKYCELVPGAALIMPNVLEDGSHGTKGTCLFRACAFRAVRGYDESHTAFGHCDTNFYARLAHAGQEAKIGPVEFEHLPHNDAARFRFIQMQETPAETEHINSKWARDVSRPVNPDGYGQFEGHTSILHPRQQI